MDHLVDRLRAMMSDPAYDRFEGFPPNATEAKIVERLGLAYDAMMLHTICLDVAEAIFDLIEKDAVERLPLEPGQIAQHPPYWVGRDHAGHLHVEHDRTNLRELLDMESPDPEAVTRRLLAKISRGVKPLDRDGPLR